MSLRQLLVVKSCNWMSRKSKLASMSRSRAQPKGKPTPSKMRLWKFRLRRWSICQAADRLTKQHDCVAAFSSSCSADCPPEKNDIAFRPGRICLVYPVATCIIGTVGVSVLSSHSSIFAAEVTEKRLRFFLSELYA